MKKGFTLIELLAVIVILAVIALIAVPRIMDAIDDARRGSYNQSEHSLMRAAKNYLVTENEKIPNESNPFVVITLDELIENDKIKGLSLSNETCDGYAVAIFNDGDITYLPYINCGDAFISEGYYSNDGFSTDVLVVAGGGGGVSTGADTAGGGAGGLIFKPSHEINNDISLSVGAGGAVGNNGQNSVFDSLTALGGGSGSTSQTSGVAGGSGGGAGRNSGVGGDGLQPNQSGDSGLYGFGNRGGTNTGHIGTEGMGGGGAGEPGYDAIGIDAHVKTGGNGLFQVTTSDGPYAQTYNFAEIFGTRYGHVVDDQVWFAGGGGGGGERGNPSQNLGGLGGGGRGGHLQAERNGGPGMPNTGGGGGGSDNAAGGVGGSGIVMIRYSGHPKATGGHIFHHNGYTIHAFTDTGNHVLELIEF